MVPPFGQNHSKRPIFPSDLIYNFQLCAWPPAFANKMSANHHRQLLPLMMAFFTLAFLAFVHRSEALRCFYEPSSSNGTIIKECGPGNQSCFLLTDCPLEKDNVYDQYDCLPVTENFCGHNKRGCGDCQICYTDLCNRKEGSAGTEADITTNSGAESTSSKVHSAGITTKTKSAPTEAPTTTTTVTDGTLGYGQPSAMMLVALAPLLIAALCARF